ncbi:MAG: LicD family protein, partial [Planctomycetes bacterium]|nr:LicD family protein [Planctomycetota bacterium]
MNKQKELMELLRGVKNVLDEHNIKFWLECGTLLGAIRDGAFIPWEKDIDFGVWQDQFPKNIKNSVAEAFIEKGFRV